MGNKDSRTDNWAGYRDYNSRSYSSFPRSAKEAGFYYGPEKKEPNMMFWIIIMFILVLGCIAWAG